MKQSRDLVVARASLPAIHSVSAKVTPSAATGAPRTWTGLAGAYAPACRFWKNAADYSCRYFTHSGCHYPLWKFL